MENSRRGSEIFLGVIGVATLVVAIIGATFAFFSASTNSDANAINVTSTTLGLGFVDSVNKNLRTHLIPASETVATYAALNQQTIGNSANNQCIDDNGNDVCGVYQFTICNGSLDQAGTACVGGANSTQDVTFELNVVTNQFTNLCYKIYEGPVGSLTNASTAKVTKTTFPATGGSATLALGNLTAQEDATGTKFRLGTTSGYDKTYTMIIWLDETGEDQSNANVAQGTTGTGNEAGQTNEAGKAFAAGLVISSGGTTGVTGVISALG